ncbi:hypothetical protein AB1Y20_018655 [Prymnesium parvum]|uniref:Major facilitator superfamily (MFS) profile domain-containing protein n=1 Tax=Prymnesium parvum TaxID=97485 RepID=A0AB34JPD0_PRYPA|mmetsp:Transcript_32408/g.67917  ORF Transcript_32408/g.67917 Transcript_32408/m.67917 type:complete len:464 (+) Transcript_32408:22-1413(+)
MVKPLLLALARPVIDGAARTATTYDPVLLAAKSEPDAYSTGLSSRQLLLFGLTYIAYVSIYFARKPVSVVKSTLEAELGLSRASLGIVDTALLSAYAVGQFMIGTIVSTFGRNVPLVTAYTLCGLATAGFGFSSSVPVMSTLWAICGFFASSVHPLLILYITDLFPASLRASAIGLWQTSQQVGGIAANTAASAVLASKGWRAVFKVSGATVAAFAPVLAAVMFYGSAGASKPPKAKPSVPAPIATKTADSTLSLPGLKSVGAAYTLVKMSRYCLMFWLPYFLSKHVGMDAATAAVMAAVFDVAGVIGSISSGFLCDAVFGGQMILSTLPFIITAAVAFLAWGGVCIAEQVGGKSLRSLHVAAMAVVGFAIASPDGVLGGAASRNLCDYAGRSSEAALAATASGIINGCGSVGAILQGGLTAQLVDVAGWSGLYFTLAVCMVGTAAVLIPAIHVESRAFNKSS